MLEPVMSPGSMSGVHWMRLLEALIDWLTARASIDLPVPGTSSKRMWPSQRMATRDSRTTSSLPLMTFSTLSTIAALAAVLDEAGIYRASVVGCSYGGSMALDFAIEFPDRVDRLVLVGSGIGGKPLGGQDAGLFEEVEAAEAAGDLDALNEA